MRYALLIPQLTEQFAPLLGNVKESPGYKVRCWLMDALTSVDFSQTMAATITARATIEVHQAVLDDATPELKAYIKTVAKIFRETYLAFGDDYGSAYAKILLEQCEPLTIKFT